MWLHSLVIILYKNCKFTDLHAAIHLVFFLCIEDYLFSQGLFTIILAFFN
jgi:hypothetical protein